MRYLPIGLDVRGRICIVVGGGRIGTRKAINLLGAGAAVTVVSPVATEAVAALASTGELRWRKRPAQEGDLEGAFLAVIASDNEELNARLVRSAKNGGVLVCDASSADRTEVIFGALHHGSDTTLAVFTDGQDPSLARKIRDRIAELEPTWGKK
jgi:precorrin-2 dehydrogenase/sirohydrochlorin ferrochelatase